MAASYDIDSKQISNSIAIKDGIAALLTTSSDEQMRLLAAYEAMKARAEAAEARVEAAEARANKAEKETDYWKKLAQKPKIVFRDNSTLNKLITGESYEYYAENSSIQGQQSPRRIGTR